MTVIYHDRFKSQSLIMVYCEEFGSFSNPPSTHLHPHPINHTHQYLQYRAPTFKNGYSEGNILDTDAQSDKELFTTSRIVADSKCFIELFDMF